MADTPFEDDYSELMPSLSPLMSAGLDPDEVLRSGDPQGMLAAARAGVPYQPKAAMQVPQVGPSSMLAQAAAPATNAPNPPSEDTGTPAVPATVTPTGSAAPASFQSAAEGQMGAARRAEAQETALENSPTADSKLAPMASQLATLQSPADANNPNGIPNPKAPQYRPTVGQRIGRGVLAGVEGLARGGIRGAVLGAVDPAAIGATAYGAPNRQFSQAAQANAQRQTATQGQIAEGEKAFGLDTARSKENIASIKDIGSMYGDVAKTLGADQKAQYDNQLADVKQQVAKAQQDNADTKANLASMKMPTTYEATVVAGALETDPAKKAAYQAAAKTMADTELKKFQYKAAQDGGGSSPFRQSMIDAATAQVQALQDNYKYNPRRNTYVDQKTFSEITPQEFTDKKNEISTKLDAQLGAKKFKPLGVRFNPADAGAGKAPGNAPAAAPQNAAVSAPPKPTAPPPPGATHMAPAKDGTWHYTDGKADLGPVK